MYPLLPLVTAHTMADSTTSKLLSTVEKFDGTNWESWSFLLTAALMFINALDIAEGTETTPTLPNMPTDEDKKNLEDWNKCSHQGLSLLLISVKTSVCQSLDMKKSLNQNWSILKANYGTRTGLNLWIDY